MHALQSLLGSRTNSCAGVNPPVLERERKIKQWVRQQQRVCPLRETTACNQQIQDPDPELPTRCMDRCELMACCAVCPRFWGADRNPRMHWPDMPGLWTSRCAKSRRPGQAVAQAGALQRPDARAPKFGRWPRSRARIMNNSAAAFNRPRHSNVKAVHVCYIEVLANFYDVGRRQGFKAGSARVTVP